MEEPKVIPDAVQKSFNNWKANWKLQRSTDRAPKLYFDTLNGYYYFVWNECYYGIELDGYLHT